MKRKIAIATVVGLLAMAGVAGALTVRAGNLILDADGGFSPTALPRHHDAPITLHGGGKLSTVTGQIPPIVETLVLEFDRHGHLETAGLPVCSAGRLEATTTPQARRNCPGSIVGEGSGSAIVAFPEQKPFRISSPITIFNGPRVHGNPSVYAHAYTTVPVPTTFIVPVVIEKINKGVYGYRTKARIPKIAGGAGHPVAGSLKIGRKWTFKGVHHSYINARCETHHLQARAEVTFKDEGTGRTFLRGTFVRPCTVRP
ncbi:MAG TPA: hypothetical protein VGF09_05725 [Solirubrobacterales bacterium]